jgi:hypothetical protein
VPFKFVPKGLQKKGLDYYETGTTVPGSEEIGVPTDGTYEDGLLPLTSTTRIADAHDLVNEVLLYLAPEAPESLDSKDLSVSGTTFYTGKLSQGNINYGPNSPGDTIDYIFYDATFSVDSPDQTDTFGQADDGILEYYLNGSLSDSIDLSANFQEADREGAQSSTPWTGANNDLSVTSVESFNSFPLWQKGEATVSVVPGDFQQGYNSIYLKRTGLSTDQTSNTLNLFYDNDSGADPSVSTPTISEASLTGKYLSGVNYYYRGSTFNLGVVGSNLFNNVYHASGPLYFTSSSSVLNAGAILETDSSVSGVSVPPAIGETMTVTNKILTATSINARSMDAQVTVLPRDPYDSYSSAQSISQGIMIDCYNQTSNDLNEYFDDEIYRLNAGNYDSIPGLITGQWSSSTVLSNGQAQLYDGNLVYPQLDFSSNLPSGNPNYSTGFSGDQVYYRAFYDNGSPHSSGTLEFGNLTSSDISPVGTGNVNVEIKLPTQTGWLDLGSPFSSGTFTGSDGDGCRVTVSGDDWNWTCGTFSTANSGWMIVVKVTIRNSSESISQIRELGW